MSFIFLLSGTEILFMFFDIYPIVSYALVFVQSSRYISSLWNVDSSSICHMSSYIDINLLDNVLELWTFWYEIFISNQAQTWTLPLLHTQITSYTDALLTTKIRALQSVIDDLERPQTWASVHGEQSRHTLIIRQLIILLSILHT